jgi:hypothetical protein
MKKLPPRWPDNVIRFRIGGWPVDTLDQEMMLTLRRKADRNRRMMAARDCLTVEDNICEGMVEWLATLEAEMELATKIVRFRRLNRGGKTCAHSTNPSAQRQTLI